NGSYKFNGKCTSSVDLILIDMKKINDPSKGFVKDGRIIVEVQVIIDKEENGNRFRTKREIDMFSPSKWSDIVLVIGEK
ncbi:hypothetical protein PFISCL1PPCAC_20260, partial [Pristionchus fissidentatus]